ncbi:LysM peptidoglycan-binding domain-containing protein [Catellatospora sichuanensis]|uniref:LysM peptidoglycan-binding domain-containing protein n=1 Tax=Catellatospora sichuanensis TaxID=1969805 RepID=UPI001182701B|nr:LysM domain-containing protein [Catellatospora sichuanensis]
MAPVRRNRPHWTLRLLAGLAALSGIVAIVAGVPVLLVELAGNPLPRHVPSLDEITAVLTSPDNGDLFLRVLTLAGWAAWATFTLGILVEIGARISGRRAARLPGLGLQQRVAAVLVGALVAVFAGASVATAALPSLPAPSAARMVATVPAAPYAGTPMAAQALPRAAPALAYTAPALPQAVLAAAAPAAALAVQHQAPPPRQRIERPVYVVKKGDYLGCIAQRFTGDFDRYQQLAALNPQLIRNPNHIEPGWRIVLPADAHDRGAIRHATGRLLLPAVETPAPQQPATPPPPATPAPVTPSTPASPPPVSPAPSTATTPAATPSAAAPSASAVPSPATRPHVVPLDETDPGTGRTRVLAAGAGLALAGVLAGHVVVRRRIRRMHRMRVGRRRGVGGVRTPLGYRSREMPPRHRATDRLDAGLRQLTAGLRGRAPWEMPDIAAAWEHGGDLAIILAAPCADAPEPFDVQWPNTWSLSASSWLPDRVETPSLLPGLLKIGTWPQGGELFVDGERTGLLTLLGDPQRCDDLLRYLVAEAATASWADGAAVTVAGLSSADMRALGALSDRVRTSSSVSDALARIGRRAAANAAVLHDSQTADMPTARINNVSGDAWGIQLLFVADPWGEHTEQLRDLDALLADLGRVGVAVIATHPTGTRWSASISSDGGVHMSWLAVTDITACELTSARLTAHVAGLAQVTRVPVQSTSGPRHRLR